MPYEQVELVGLVSNICVLSTPLLARAALPQARIRYRRGLYPRAGPARCRKKALDVMQGLGIKFTTGKFIVAVLRQKCIG